MGGQYGIVRTPARTPVGQTFTRLHQGIDIRPVYRNRQGEPLDTVRAIDRGTVVYVNNAANGSNYGRYVVVRHEWEGVSMYSLSAHLASVWVHRGTEVEAGQPLGRMGYTGRGINRETAHLHLEIGMLLNTQYQRWHGAFRDWPKPLRLAWGMRDPVFQPVFLDQWSELFPDATTVELGDASHFLIEDRPDAVVEAIAEFV
jgi:murein DD-endopeptidase MepM/ murein hydrolase activator NlpD